MARKPVSKPRGRRPAIKKIFDKAARELAKTPRKKAPVKLVKKPVRKPILPEAKRLQAAFAASDSRVKAARKNVAARIAKAKGPKPRRTKPTGKIKLQAGFR